MKPYFSEMKFVEIQKASQDFLSLLNREDTLEKEIHKFLAGHAYFLIFGPYIVSLRQVCVT